MQEIKKINLSLGCYFILEIIYPVIIVISSIYFILRNIYKIVDLISVIMGSILKILILMKVIKLEIRSFKEI